MNRHVLINKLSAYRRWTIQFGGGGGGGEVVGGEVVGGEVVGGGDVRRTNNFTKLAINET